MTNTVYDITTARCCITCVIGETNDDFSSLSDEQYARWIIGRQEVNLRGIGWEWSGVLCDDANEYDGSCATREAGEECASEGWFSWSPCEWCGDTDGGDRFNVAIMRRIA